MLAARSRCGEVERSHAREVKGLAGDPQVVGILHGQPAFGAAADRFREPKCHLGRNAARTGEHTAERRGCDIESSGQLATAHAERLEVHGREKLAGVRRVVHESHVIQQ